MPFSKILVPIDFSDSSTEALRLAVQMASSGQSVLTLIHVVMDPSPLYGQVGAPGVGGSTLREIVRAQKESRLESLRELRSQEVSAAVDGQIVVRVGYPPHVITALAADHDHDLIVMGTHGRTGLKRVFLGSVAERVIREAPCPVLVTREPPAPEVG